MKILLVEDDPVSALLCKSFLNAMGHEVISEDTGEKAWLSILTGNFSLIISDWNLPGQSGLDLCEKIRQRKSRGYTYFILITSYSGREKLEEAMHAGIDDFLSKPIDFDSLTMRIRVAERIIEFHAQIGALQDLLPICMYCKKIRGDQEFWQNVETFFSTHVGADFTHALCPDCYHEKIQPEMDELKPPSPARDP